MSVADVTGVWIAALLTLAIFTFLFKDNPFYRFAEHLVVGVSAGYWVAILYHTSLKDLWLDPLAVNFTSLFTPGGSMLLEIGKLSMNIIPGLLGLMMFARFFEKAAWLSRWPIAFYLAITRHGQTLGFYIPAQKRSRKVELDAMRAAAKELDEMIASWGVTEDELMEEYKQIRRRAREKKRNAR